MDGWWEVCRRCGAALRLAGRWRCACGGMLDLVGPRTDPLAQPGSHTSMWRYSESMPAPPTWTKTTLGEGHTPLVEFGEGLWVKSEQVSPTGSFKDRGAAVLLSIAAWLGAGRVVADSSGNAGKAVAAYAARTGIAAEIYVPEGTPGYKTAAAGASGAGVVTVEGDRAAAARAAVERVESGGGWYASHVHQPAFVHGVKTLAFEVFEQLGGRAPGTVVVPAGNGTLVQGVWLGFSELVAAGRAQRVPAIVAVQAERCAPLAGLPVPGEPTAAAGIQIASPPRGEQVRAAVVASGGRVVTVTEDEIASAVRELALGGLAVEPTGAVAWAARGQVAGGSGEPAVFVLSGR